jgi:prophage tail gpP-like protein
MTDLLTIVSDGHIISGWETISVTRSIEEFPSSFVVTLTEIGQIDIPLRKDFSCTVYMDDTLVMTGYIDAVSRGFDNETHRVSIRGRSICSSLHDWSAILKAIPPGTINPGNVAQVLLGSSLDGVNAQELAQRLATPYGIAVDQLAPDFGGAIPTFPINQGETPYQIIERIARWQGFLVYDNPEGHLVLNTVGTTRHSSGFQQGQVKSFSSEFDGTQQASDYIGLWSSVDVMADTAPGSNPHGFATDSDVPRLKVLIVISEQSIMGQSIAQRLIDWEKNRRWGRSQQVELVVRGWRDSAGDLWTPNQLALVNLPSVQIVNKIWTISKVVYKQDDASGTTTELILMPPEAFSVEPAVPQNVDADQYSAINSGSANAVFDSLPAYSAPEKKTISSISDRLNQLKGGAQAK